MRMIVSFWQLYSGYASGGPLINCGCANNTPDLGNWVWRAVMFPKLARAIGARLVHFGPAVCSR